MKKLVVALAAMLAVAAIATTATAASGGTVVDSGFPCAVLDGNGSTFITTNSTLTVYDSGKVVLKCNGNGAGAPSLTYFNYANTGITCNVAGYETTDWVDKVGRNGNSQLTCSVTFSGDDIASASSSGSAGLG